MKIRVFLAVGCALLSGSAAADVRSARQWVEDLQTSEQVIGRAFRTENAAVISKTMNEQEVYLSMLLGRSAEVSDYWECSSAGNSLFNMTIDFSKAGRPGISDVLRRNTNMFFDMMDRCERKLNMRKPRAFTR